MYIDPTGESFILACIIVGAIIGATITYNEAKNRGIDGNELFFLTILGETGGGLAGYLLAPLVSSFLSI
jgi:hypothetical protein